MRILLTHHFPLDDSQGGKLTRDLANALAADGHQVRCVILDCKRGGNEHFLVRRIVCDPSSPNADLPFALPHFENGPGRQSFAQLTEGQLVEYRDLLRTVLDIEIHEFDPHVIHAQHVWIQAHLALEAGVPYVLNAWGPELAACRQDHRYLRLAQEAAENAGRILLPSPGLKQDLAATFGELDDHVVTLAPSDPPSNGGSQWYASLYQDVLASRFGGQTRP